MKNRKKFCLLAKRRGGGNKLFPFLAEMSSSISEDVTQTTAPGDNCISQPAIDRAGGYKIQLESHQTFSARCGKTTRPSIYKRSKFFWPSTVKLLTIYNHI